jgi:hypothetical protein
LSGLYNGTVNQETLTPEAATTFKPEDLKGYRDYFDDLGAIKKVELVERKEEGGVRTYRYRVTFERDDHVLALGLDPQEKVTVFYFE